MLGQTIVSDPFYSGHTSPDYTAVLLWMSNGNDHNDLPGYTNKFRRHVSDVGCWAVAETQIYADSHEAVLATEGTENTEGRKRIRHGFALIHADFVLATECTENTEVE